MGFGLIIGYTEHLYLVTTNNYKAVTNIHILQITITQAKSQTVTVITHHWWLQGSGSHQWISLCFRSSSSYWLPTVSQFTNFGWVKLLLVLASTFNLGFRIRRYLLQRFLLWSYNIYMFRSWYCSSMR
jgi:hypothetical protein